MNHLKPQFHDDLDALYGSDQSLWDQAIQISRTDCFCMYPYADCWKTNSESFVANPGCEEEESYSYFDYLTVDSMSKWTKGRIEDIQVGCFLFSAKVYVP